MPMTPKMPPVPFACETGLSRRRLLAMSALGASAGLVGQPLLAQIAGAPTSPPGAAPQAPAWSTSDMPSQKGRTVLITGGNGYPLNGRSGLGYHDARGFAHAGANVIIASRNQAKGDEAVRLIRAEVPGATIRFERFDLTDLATVHALAERMASLGRLDLLINNAGVMGRLTRETSAQGYERVLATNSIGHFALTAQLMPLLRRGRNPRVVWMASSRMAPAIPFDDLNMEQRYDYAAAYDISKLANLTLALEMDRRSQAGKWGVASVAVHPGVARTNLVPDGPGMDSVEGRRQQMVSAMFGPPDRGALSTLYAATMPQVESGSYYGPGRGGGPGPGPAGGMPPMAPPAGAATPMPGGGLAFLAQGGGTPGPATIPPAARDTASAAMLWARMEEMTHLRFA